MTFLFKTQFSNFNVRFFLDRIGFGAHVFFSEFYLEILFHIDLSLS